MRKQQQLDEITNFFDSNKKFLESCKISRKSFLEWKAGLKLAVDVKKAYMFLFGGKKRSYFYSLMKMLILVYEKETEESWEFMKENYKTHPNYRQLKLVQSEILSIWKTRPGIIKRRKK